MNDIFKSNMLALFDEYNKKFKSLSADSSDGEVIALFDNLIASIQSTYPGFRDYRQFELEWNSLIQGKREVLEEASLLTYIGLLIFVSREEHCCGEMGYRIIKWTKDGTICFLLEHVIARLHAIEEQENVDKGTTLGVSGEYFVAAELTRLGYIASLTSKNTKAIDLIASSKNAKRSVCIQIKTCSNKERNTWMMNKACEDNVANNLYYVFVNLRKEETPEYFIVPSKLVSDRISSEHQKWLATPGKNGKPHNDTDMRKFNIYKEDIPKYQNAWYLLGLD